MHISMRHIYVCVCTCMTSGCVSHCVVDPCTSVLHNVTSPERERERDKKISIFFKFRIVNVSMCVCVCVCVSEFL